MTACWWCSWEASRDGTPICSSCGNSACDRRLEGRSRMRRRLTQRLVGSCPSTPFPSARILLRLQHDARQITHAPQPAMRSPNAERERVHCRTSEFWKCGVARVGSRREPFVGRVAPDSVALRHVPAACGVCMDCGLAPVKSALATLGVCPRSAEVGPDACRAESERRHVDPDDQPLTRLALRQRLSAPLAPPPTKLPASGSG